MHAIEGVPCHFNQLIESIKQNDDHVKVQFKDGRTQHYDLVIGADGTRSKTRGMVFDKDDYKLVNLGACFSEVLAKKFADFLKQMTICFL